MSYILEALKKSDKKRQDGKVPDLETVSEESKYLPQKRRLWPYIVTGALFINAAVIAIWLVVADDNENPVQVAAQTTTPKTQVAQGTASSPAKAPQSATPSPGKPPAAAPSFIPKIQPGLTSDPVIKERQEKPVILADSQGAKVPVHPVTPKTLAPDIQKQKPAIREIPTDDSEQIETVETEYLQEDFSEEPPAESVLAEAFEENGEESWTDTETLVPEQPKQQRRATKTFQPPASAPHATEKKNILDIMQLPGTIQTRLPQFRVSAHFYSSTPSSRLASVNGRVMREGQNLSTGLTLKEITPDGLIFSFEGYLFSVGIY